MKLSKTKHCLPYINRQLDGFLAGWGHAFPLDVQHLVAEWLINDRNLLCILSEPEYDDDGNYFCGVHGVNSDECLHFGDEKLTKELRLAKWETERKSHCLSFMLPSEISYEMAKEAVLEAPLNLRRLPCIHRTFELYRLMLNRHQFNCFRQIEAPSLELWWWALARSRKILRWLTVLPEEDFLVRVIQNWPSAIRWIPLRFLTTTLLELAVVVRGSVLRFVLSQTERICLLAIRRDPQAFRFVKIQTPEICSVAVRLYAHNILLVEEPTEELCVAAVFRDPKVYPLLAREFKTPELRKWL